MTGVEPAPQVVISKVVVGIELNVAVVAGPELILLRIGKECKIETVIAKGSLPFENVIELPIIQLMIVAACVSTARNRLGLRY